MLRVWGTARNMPYLSKLHTSEDKALLIPLNSMFFQGPSLKLKFFCMKSIYCTYQQTT